MAIEYLKKASKTPETGEENTREIVANMLRDIEEGGEDRVRHYANELDGWTGDIVVTPEEIKRAGEQLSQHARDDIHFAYERVRDFAIAQRGSMQEFETEFIAGWMVEPGEVYSGHTWVVFKEQGVQYLFDPVATDPCRMIRQLSEVASWYVPQVSIDHNLTQYVYGGYYKQLRPNWES